MTQVSTTTFSNIFLNGNYLLPKCPEQLKKFLNLRRTFSAIRVAAPRTAAAAPLSRPTGAGRSLWWRASPRPETGSWRSSPPTRTRRWGRCRRWTRRRRPGSETTTTWQSFNRIKPRPLSNKSNNSNNKNNSSSNSSNSSSNSQEVFSLSFLPAFLMSDLISALTCFHDWGLVTR